jgi:hypothetical protein
MSTPPAPGTTARPSSASTQKRKRRAPKSKQSATKVAATEGAKGESAATTATDSDPEPAEGKEDSILSDPPGSDDETGPRLEYSGKTLLSASPKGSTS